MIRFQQKKGDVFQVLFMIVLLLAVAMVGLLCFVLTDRFNTTFEDTGVLEEHTTAQAAIDDMQDVAPKVTDYAILFLFLAMNIGIFVSAVRTNFSAVVIFLFILLTFIAVMVAAGAVNIYQGLAQQLSIIDVSSELTFTNFIFSKYFPLIVCFICGLSMLIMYGKSGSDIVS